MISDHRRVPLPFCINCLFYLYRYGEGAYSIFVCPLVVNSSLYRGVEQLEYNILMCLKIRKRGHFNFRSRVNSFKR
ncbi:hypothetical protein RIF29_43237 [Crotalaria pallida]|uniref:Uncharacterized protein n=1 Tax=Crotalaria pallida TaxID=3830 RepID=A0AAN9DX63_CROPI